MQPPLPEPLTDRERDVLHLMSRGYSNRQIADKLFISVETVRWYSKQIYGKLGVHSRTQATLRAQELTEQKPVEAQQHHSPVFSNLPSYGVSFIGRQQEIGEVITLLRDPNVRLVTIAGPGGMGKTRLAIEAARRLAFDFLDGIVYVPLATVTGIEEMLPVILRSLRLRLRSVEDPYRELFAYLQDQQLLLLLDNFEHLLPAADMVGRLLQATHHVKVLVTSITSLNLHQEWVRHLDGLAYSSGPAGATFATGSTAASLFAERARRVQGDFDLDSNLDCVEEICRLVSGMPLALEMAAGWLKTLSCDQVASEIRHNKDFLASRQRQADNRHHSLRALFDYAWQLLTDHERRILQRLSVFRGHFSRQTAEQIAGADLLTLSDLVDKSFLYQPSPGLFAFHDLLRHYAKRTLQDTPSGVLTTRSGMLLTWSLFVQGDFERAGDLADSIIDAASGIHNPIEEAFALAVLGVLAGMDEDYERGWQLCQASLTSNHQAGLDQDPITCVFAHLGLAVAACGQRDYPEAWPAIATALQASTGLGSPAFVTLCLPVTAILLAYEAEPEQAAELLNLALAHPASTPTWMEKWPVLVQLRQDLAQEVGPGAFHPLSEGSLASPIEELLPVQALFQRLAIVANGR